MSSNPEAGERQQLEARAHRQLEAGLGAGVRNLFSILPEQSALRKPFVRLLLDGLSDEQLAELKLPLKPETIRRYRNEEVDLEPLLVKRRHVEKVTNKAFEERLAKARAWVVDECGVTQSDGKATTLRTPLVLHQLFVRYQQSVADHISVNPFGTLVKEMHVQLGVPAVDTMTCAVCREWSEEVDELETCLLSESDSATRLRKEKERDELIRKVYGHQEAVIHQSRAWKADLNEVEHNPDLVLCALDFSMFELMNHETINVFCVVIVDAVGGKIRRRYFDFIDVKLPGREHDIVFFVLTVLYQTEAFSKGQRVRLWSSAGSGDFRNAPCLFSFLNLNSVCKGLTFESFNFFGARHEGSECDRHFWIARKAIKKWRAEKASSEPNLLLDVGQCGRILARLPDTVAYGCTDAEIDGVEQA